MFLNRLRASPYYRLAAALKSYKAAMPERTRRQHVAAWHFEHFKYKTFPILQATLSTSAWLVPSCL